MLWEVPVSATRKFGWAIPFSGGNYVRQLPQWPVREAVARWVERRQAPLVMYFHIWELDSEQPSISAASWLQRLRHYRNLSAMPARVRYFLERYPFTSISDYLSLADEAATKPSATAASVDERVASPSEPVERVDLTVIVPCYNEEASLPYLQKTLRAFGAASRDSLGLQFVFVDDGSVDATWNRLDALFGPESNCKLLRHSENRGIAAAILTGVKHSETDLVAVLDADCTFDPMQLRDMVPMMSDGIAAVSASPFHARGRVQRAGMAACALQGRRVSLPLRSTSPVFELHELFSNLSSHGHRGAQRLQSRLLWCG